MPVFLCCYSLKTYLQTSLKVSHWWLTAFVVFVDLITCQCPERKIGLEIPVDDRAYEIHDDVIKWKHFPRHWPFVRGIRRSPVNSPHKGQWRGAWMFSLIYACTNGWVNNRDTGGLRRHRAHYNVTVMRWEISQASRSWLIQELLKFQCCI